MATSSTDIHDSAIDFESFEWKPEHDELLNSIADTNLVDCPWPKLSNLIRHKIHSNIALFLATPPPAPVGPPSPLPIKHSTPVASPLSSSQLLPSPFSPTSEVQMDAPPHLPSTTAHFDLPSLIPPLTASPESHLPSSDSKGEEGSKKEEGEDTIMQGGMDDTKVEEAEVVDAVMQEEEDGQRKDSAGAVADEKAVKEELGPMDVIGGRTLPSRLNQEQAETMEKGLQMMLDDFETRPPFTIQRLCELLTTPQALHSSLGKYLRALERALLVTSEWTPAQHLSPFHNNNNTSLSMGAHRETNGSGYSSGGSTPRGGNTPLYSPIPFLLRAEMELDGDRGDDSEEGDLGGGNGESGLLPAMSPMTLGSPLSTLESPPSDSAATFPSTSNDSTTHYKHEATENSNGPLLFSLPQSSSEHDLSLDRPQPQSHQHPHPSSSIPPPAQDSTTDELIVDELDAGPIPSSILAPSSSSSSSPLIGPSVLSPTGNPSPTVAFPSNSSPTTATGSTSDTPLSQHPHLLSSSPRALSSTTIFPPAGSPPVQTTAAREAEGAATSACFVKEERNVRSRTHSPEREEPSTINAGDAAQSSTSATSTSSNPPLNDPSSDPIPHPIPTPAAPAPSSNSPSSAKTDLEDRFIRSASPTPDPEKIAEEKAEGLLADVEVPGEKGGPEASEGGDPTTDGGGDTAGEGTGA